MATTTGPKNLKHQRPASGIPGWAAAWTHLDRIDSDRQRSELARIVRTLGVQGAPALDYAAWGLAWLTGLRTDPPVPRRALKEDERVYVERRVREELLALGENGRALFPTLQKSLHA